MIALLTNEGAAAPQGLPSQGVSGMPEDEALHGRTERRLPLIVVVRLANSELPGSDGTEWTYTDNVSGHGARVFSKRLWRPGEEIAITPFNEQTTQGNVVYCERLTGGRCFIGVNLKDRVAWSMVRRYNDIKTSAPPLAKPS